MKAASAFVSQYRMEIALAVAGVVVGIYLINRIFGAAEAVGGAVSDAAKSVATGAGKTVDTANSAAKLAGSFTPVGLAADAARTVAAPVVKSVSTGGVTGALGDLADWVRGTSYDPNAVTVAPTTKTGGLK